MESRLESKNHLMETLFIPEMVPKFRRSQMFSHIILFTVYSSLVVEDWRLFVFDQEV